ncbi:pentatricopeptide repeat-containing protein At4g22760-like [Asparagus officinalis]|uniref:pentatricopeptide repeat-containing protein At4g22760-like n=1 Tax=Asparagus officinalis TaxID=4686 RepID=UPI00098DFBB9|nr:pentatricopeptide repeat-containing protein At4g22760-like [Asparagus officinalis]
MYYKCGSLKDVCLVFDKMPEKDVVAWNSMIAGHAMHGHSWCKNYLVGAFKSPCNIVVTFSDGTPVSTGGMTLVDLFVDALTSLNSKNANDRQYVATDANNNNDALCLKILYEWHYTLLGLGL